MEATPEADPTANGRSIRLSQKLPTRSSVKHAYLYIYIWPWMVMKIMMIRRVTKRGPFRRPTQEVLQAGPKASESSRTHKHEGPSRLTLSFTLFYERRGVLRSDLWRKLASGLQRNSRAIQVVCQQVVRNWSSGGNYAILQTI